MIVGVATVMLDVPAQSLKEKRRVVKSVIDRVRRQFNVSISEVDHQELWQTATLGIAYVTNDGKHAHRVLQKVVRWIERQRLDAALADYSIELW